MIVVFDLGTTRLKVSAFDMEGQLIGQAARRNQVFSSEERSWQSADEWWRNCIDGFADLVRERDINTSDVRGISVSGRAGACVFVDNAGEVLLDPWIDNRHRVELQTLNHDQPEAALYANTLIAKYLWLSKHEPELAEKTHNLLYAKDFLIFKLTGAFVTDPSSGPDSYNWQTDIDVSLLPEVASPWSLAGSLSSAAADALNLKPKLPVAVGAHDGVCANTGACMIKPGEYALTLGTHAVSRTVTETLHPDALRFYCYPPDKHVYGANALYAGRTIDWGLSTLFGHKRDLDPEELNALNESMDELPIGSNGITFLPYPGGQINPESRASGSGVFHGISLENTRSELLHAVFEGTAIAIMRNYRHLSQETGYADVITLTGGGIVFTSWLKILANLLESPLEVSDSSSEGRGAAMFCGIAIGDFTNLEQAMSAMRQPTTTIEPSTRWDAYQGLIARFERLNSLY